MKKLILLLFIPLVSFGQASDLFFSQYGEGSGNNKFLEIYNGTGQAVDLSNYAFPNANGGSDGNYEYWNEFLEGAVIADGDVYVIAHPSANAEILAIADQTHPYLSNGDDGYALIIGTESQYSIIDFIGDFGDDPGSGWDVAGIAQATKDHTLTRKSYICQGNIDWELSRGTNDENSEWIVTEQNDFTGLGSHIAECSFGQGVQLYADGTDIDQNGNTFEWIKYGNQDWSIENAEVVTYRDGTPIPQVTDPNEWTSLSTGAWCYYDNDPAKGKLYNWYAVAGIHDEAALLDTALRKEFAPEGWRVPIGAEWTTLQWYLTANGYNYDETDQGNKVAKSMSSNTGWDSTVDEDGSPGNNQSLNNKSGFNALPQGYRDYGPFVQEGKLSFFWTYGGSVSNGQGYSQLFSWINPALLGSFFPMEWGFSVRFMRDTQGQQSLVDGYDIDQNGNTFEWINYEEYEWSVKNAEVVTYRDGTPIPQVTDADEWENLLTGAWCYYDNDPAKGKLYNWFAVAGIHDNDESTPNKEFAPEGWRVPNKEEWDSLKDYLAENGYGFGVFPNSSSYAIAKAMASTNGWDDNPGPSECNPGYNQSTNNLSGFNALPTGIRSGYVPNGWDYPIEYLFSDLGKTTLFWSSSYYGTMSDFDLFGNGGYAYYVNFNTCSLPQTASFVNNGGSVRFIRNASTASLNDLEKSIKIFPNPSSKYINVNVNSELEAVVFDLLGKELLREKINGRFDISSLEKGTYILNLTDGTNTSTNKIIKE